MRPPAMLLACLLTSSLASLAGAQSGAGAPGDAPDAATRQNRHQVVGDMVRVGLITTVLQGPPGILRVAIGDGFDSSPAKEFYFAKLATAYHGWAPVGTSVLVELYDQGQKFGEFADGVFTMGAPFSTPRECTKGEAGCPPASIAQVPQASGSVKPDGVPPIPRAQKPQASVAPPGAEGDGMGDIQPVRAAADEPLAASRGRWLATIGLGYGNQGFPCNGCGIDRLGGYSGVVNLAFAAVPTVYLGMAGEYWHDSRQSTDIRLLTGLGTITAYATSRSPIFLRLGFGVMSYKEKTFGLDLTGSRAAASATLGGDVFIAPRVVLAPYAGYTRTLGDLESSAEDDLSGFLSSKRPVDVFQIGLALTYR